MVRATGDEPVTWTEVPSQEAAELLRRLYNDCIHDCGHPSAAYLAACLQQERVVVLKDGYPVNEVVALHYDAVPVGGVVPVITLKRPEEKTVEHHEFTAEDRANSRLALRASHAARKRLVAAHRDEFRALEDEERALLGLKPRTRPMPLSEMKRLAELAIEHGLGDKAP